MDTGFIKHFNTVLMIINEAYVEGIFSIVLKLFYGDLS